MKKLTLKQKKFAEEVIKTRNATEAAFRSYNVSKRGSAEVIGSNNMKKPRILNEIDRLMEEQKITDEFMMKQLKEGMKADVVSSYKGEAEQTEIPDHNVRFKYLEAGMKLKDWFPSEKIESRNINIDIQLEEMSKEELSRLLSEYLNNLNKSNEPIKNK